MRTRKTRIVDLFATIRKTKIPFLSIFFFVLLGTLIFSGIGWTGQAFSDSVGATYAQTEFHDFKLLSPSGFSDDVVRELEKIDGIEYEFTDVMYAPIEYEGIRYNAKIQKIPKQIDRFYNVEGRLPEATGEAAVLLGFARNAGISIGDAVMGFRVTAIVDQAEYLCRNPENFGVSPDTSALIDAIVYLTDGAFDMVSPCDHAMLLRFSELRALEGDVAEYDRAIGKYEAALHAVCDGRGIEVVSRNVNFTQNLRKDTFVQIFRNMRTSMALPFLLISVFLCFTVISRIVTDDRKLIGTRKALGFRDREIAATYLGYVWLASGFGFVIGLLLGVFLIETALIGALRSEYAMIGIRWCFWFGETALLFLAEFAAITLITLCAVRVVLRRPTTELLADISSSSAQTRAHWYEKLPVWRRVPLLTKTVINNVAGERLRVSSMLIGITGSMLLLVGGCNLVANIYESSGIQLGKIQSFDTVVYFDRAEEGCREELEAYLEEEDLPHTAVYYTAGVSVMANGIRARTVIFASEDKTFGGLLRMYGEDGQAHDVGDLVWMNRNYLAKEGIKAGGTVPFIDARQKEYELTIDAGADSYLTRPQMFMSTATYARLFGEEPTANTIFVRRGGTDLRAFAIAVQKIGGVFAVHDQNAEFLHSFHSFGDVCAAAGILFIVLSVGMAFLVILNLLDMYIREKKEELRVLLINGYSVKDAKRYIRTDTAILSGIGLAVGSCLGFLLSYVCVDMITTAATYFRNGIHPAACIGIAAGALLLFVISQISLRRIDRLPLTGTDL